MFVRQFESVTLKKKYSCYNIYISIFVRLFVRLVHSTIYVYVCTYTYSFDEIRICFATPTPCCSYMFGVRHADPVLHDLLPSFDLLHDAHQLTGVVRHLLGEAADAVGHVQDGRPDLVGLRLQDGVLMGNRMESRTRTTLKCRTE